MIPNLELFGKTISPYMLLVLAGALAAYFFLYLEPERHGLDPIHASRMGLFSALGIAVGGCLLYGLTNVQYLVALLRNLHKATSFGQVVQALRYIFGGSVYYGGLLGYLGVSFLYLRRARLPMGSYTDLGACAIPLFHTFGRIGCFLSGCCFGIPWEHGPVMEHCPIEGANGVPRFPVQLVEAGVNLALFVLLFTLLRKGKMRGKLLGLYLVIYPVCRFGLEFLRGDAYRGILWGLSTSQWISMGLLTCAIVFFLRQKTTKTACGNDREQNRLPREDQ